MAEARYCDTGHAQTSSEPKYKEVPALLLVQTTPKVSFSGRGLVLGTDLLGKPTRDALDIRTC
jgi:hypothetical protein